MSLVTAGSFNPAFHFLGLIQKAIADGVSRHCVHVGGPDIYIVPKEQLYYCADPSIDALQGLCLAAPFDVRVELVPDWQPNKPKDLKAGRMLISYKKMAEQPTLIAKPLAALLWYAAYVASNGRLLQGQSAQTPVRLRSSPNFSYCFHNGHDIVLAAFMLEHSAELTAVAEKTGVPLPQVYDFFNASVVLGLVEAEPSLNFDPANYLLSVLDMAKADGQVRRCALVGVAPLYIVPSEGCFYSEADVAGIAKYCTAPLSDMEVGPLDETEQEETVQVGRMVVRRKTSAAALPKVPPRPLSGLLFRAALYASQGRLMTGYALDTPVRLKDWPDKAMLKESAAIKEERYFFPISAYMTGNTATLTDIAAALHLSLPEVINFHNACVITGLL